MILLIGPGGAGKTTIGTALAERLGTRLVDLDAVFRSRHGDISAYIDDAGYAAYAKQNVDLFANLVVGRDRPDIVALSSGFMTYAPDVDPSYPFWREWVAASPLTFVLLPSLQLEVCIREIVRRQLGRPFARSARNETGRRRDHPEWIADREPNAPFPPVHGENAGHAPWTICWKNSLLCLDLDICFRRNSIPSTSGMSPRKLRSR